MLSTHYSYKRQKCKKMNTNQPKYQILFHKNKTSVKRRRIKNICNKNCSGFCCRRVVIDNENEMPNDYGTTPGGTIFGTTPGGIFF